MDGSVVSIVPINSDSGKRAYASQQVVANLREGIKVPGTVVAVTKSEARIFKPPTAKGAHKGWDEYSCLSAVVAELDTHGICLSCVMDTGVVKSFSIPGLKEIGEVRLSDYYDPSRLADTILLDSGYIFGWTSQAECMLLYMWGKGQRLLVLSSRKSISRIWVANQNLQRPFTERCALQPRSPSPDSSNDLKLSVDLWNTACHTRRP